MKTITLHDIMESLTNDDIKNAQTSLHEWFVERSRQIHSQLTGSDTNESVINENEDDVIFDALDGVAGLIANGEQEGVTEVDLGDNLADLYWKSVAYDPNANLKDGSFKSEIEELKAKAGGNVFDHGYFTEQGDQVGIIYVVTMSGMDESVSESDDYEAEVEAIKNKKFSEMTDQEVKTFLDCLPEADSRYDDLQDEIGAEYEDNGPSVFVSDNIFWGKELTFGVTAYTGPGQGEDEHLPKLMAQVRGAKNYGGITGFGETEDGDHDVIAWGYILKIEDVDVNESGDDYNDLVAELKEAFAGLEAVSDKLQNVEGAQVGEEGKVPVNKKSTLPSHKGDKRVGGAPVAIKSKDHNGHALEKSPKVTDVKTKGNVQNSKDDPKKVAAPKGALLNKMDGSVNTQSPISGKGAKGLKK